MNGLDLRPMTEYESRAQRWLWDSMIPANAVSLLAGAGGSSKSTLALHLAAQVTRGRLQGDYYGTPKGVVYLTKENDPSTGLHPKLMVAGADMSRMFVMGGAKSVNVANDAHRRELLDFARTNDVALIVLDPLMVFLDGMKNSYSGTQHVLTKLNEACAKEGIALVGINHLTKGGKKPDATSMMGNMALSATARHVVMVGKTEDECLVGVVKSNVGPTKHGWLFNVRYEAIGEDEELGGRVIDAPVVELIRPAKRHEVKGMFEDREDLADDMRTTTLLMYVSEHPGCDSVLAAEHLQEEFAIKDRSARTTIGEAVSSGLVHRVGQGQGADLWFRLTITESGRRLLGDVSQEVEMPPALGAFKAYGWVEAQ